VKGHFFKPNCKCESKKCKCGASWAYIIDIGKDPKTGKRQQKKKSRFKTKLEAQNAAAELIVELQKGTYVKEDSSITFKEFAYQWLSIYEKTGKVKESTVRVRKHEITRLLDYFALLKLKDITRKRYQDALNDLSNRGFAQNTIDGAHRTGRMIFKKAIEMEILKKDPTDFTQVPQKQKTVEELEEEKDVPKYLEKDDLQTFLRTSKEFGLEMDYLIFLTLSYTGMRAGELCSLKWKDINFEEQTISIRRTYYNPKNNKKLYKLLPPKTPNAVRVIDVDETVMDELKQYQGYQEKVKEFNKDTYHDGDFIFTDEYGYPFYIKKIENRMRRLLKIISDSVKIGEMLLVEAPSVEASPVNTYTVQSGDTLCRIALMFEVTVTELKQWNNLSVINTELTPHSLRHTHTSLLAQAGVSLPEIMDRLGHKDEDTTKNVYLHVTKDMKKEASKKFKNLMENL
jgi:integrase